MTTSHHQVLLSCYNDQAERFGHTRKKKRPEVTLLKEYLRDRPVGDVVDVGCGTGRLYEAVRDLSGLRSYVGVDAAASMIALAREYYPDATFLHDDMVHFFSDQPQESLDTIIALASFHHLETTDQRRITLHHMYKSLRRNGRCVLVNRSFSFRFLKKYRAAVLRAQVQHLISGGRYHRNDILVPRKAVEDGAVKKIYPRLYHLFTLSELTALARETGFVVDTVSYVSQDGAISSNRSTSRNSLLCLRKAVG